MSENGNVRVLGPVSGMSSSSPVLDALGCSSSSTQASGSPSSPSPVLDVPRRSLLSSSLACCFIPSFVPKNEKKKKKKKVKIMKEWKHENYITFVIVIIGNIFVVVVGTASVGAGFTRFRLGITIFAATRNFGLFFFAMDAGSWYIGSTLTCMVGELGSGSR